MQNKVTALELKYVGSANKQWIDYIFRKVINSRICKAATFSSTLVFSIK